MVQIQLDLFQTEEECEMIQLRKSINEIHKTTEKVRKKLFAENGANKKIIEELRERLEIIERNICKGQ